MVSWHAYLQSILSSYQANNEGKLEQVKPISRMPLVNVFISIGQTTLICYRSRVVDHLSAGSSGNTACVLYIYCDYKGSQTLEMILSALVRQLALRTGHVTPETKNLFNKHNKNGTRPWRQDWISILRPSLEKQDKGFIVIDALDELEADYILPNFLDEILKLQALTSILLVSREMETIRGKLSCVAIIEVRATDGDVRRHCQEFLALKDCLQEHLADNANFGLELTESIVSKAQGM